jgi:cation transport ATPase
LLLHALAPLVWQHPLQSWSGLVRWQEWVFSLKDFKALGGLGVEAMVSGHKVHVGKPDWFDEKESSPGQASKLIKETSAQGKTVMPVEVDGKAAGMLALSDVEKQGSKDMITELKGMDIEAVLLTGDNAYNKTEPFLLQQGHHRCPLPA